MVDNSTHSEIKTLFLHLLLRLNQAIINSYKEHGLWIQYLGVLFYV